MARARLARLGYHQSQISPYADQFSGIAPTATDVATLTLEQQPRRGVIQLYFAHLNPQDSLSDAQAASIAWARQAGQPNIDTAHDWTVSFPTTARADHHDAIGWHDNTRDIFVIIRYARAPALTTQQLLVLLAHT
jgi:hypothetical protein